MWLNVTNWDDETVMDLAEDLQDEPGPLGEMISVVVEDCEQCAREAAEFDGWPAAGVHGTENGES